MSAGCSHPRWVNPRGSGSPLACPDCGALWPGCPLPEPAHQREGYGPVKDQPSWRSRVAAMAAADVGTDTRSTR